MKSLATQKNICYNRQKKGDVFMIRKATAVDLDQIERIYTEIEEREENGTVTTGWKKGIYPVRSTAQQALDREDLFVYELDGRVLASAVINRLQVDVYAGADWQYKADDSRVMVIHTLAVSSSEKGKGIGTAFVRYFEAAAKAAGCEAVRLDTNETNTPARKLYAKLGYREVCTVPCVFNKLEGIRLVLIEKPVL